MDLSQNKTFEAFLIRTRSVVDSELDTWLRAERWPEDFDRALRHVLEGAGKAVRPALIFAVGRALSGENTFVDSALKRLALSVELLHTYSLVHDDLPAMDDDSFRRGRPTLHVLRGDAFAILAGDALLTASFQCLAEAFVSQPEKLPRAVALLARAAGAKGMIDGQWLDMRAEDQGLSSHEMLESIHRKKTGALISVSGLLAALKVLSLRDFDLLEKEIATWGEDLGLLFQMVDDLLDARATRAELGKTPGKDASSGKLTYVALLGAPVLEKRIYELAARLSRAQFATQSDTLSDLVGFVASRGF